MLTHKRFSELQEAIPGIDASYSFPRGMLAKSKIARILRKGSFDTIIDLQNNMVSRQLCALLRVRRVFRFRRSRWNRWQRIHLKFLEKVLKTPEPVAIGYLNSVSQLGVCDDSKGLDLNISDFWRDTVNSRLNEYRSEIGFGKDYPLLIISPGAAHATKSLPVNRWVELLNLLNKDGYPGQVLIGGKSDMARCAAISQSIAHPVLNTTGHTSLPELIALIKAGSVLVTGDSGPMHIASAVKTPLIAIFGPTVPEFGFAPFRCKHELIEIADLNCRPCTAHGTEKCPKRHFRCMNDINLDDIVAAMKRFVLVPRGGE